MAVRLAITSTRVKTERHCRPPGMIEEAVSQRESMMKQQTVTSSQNHFQLPVWKRLILVTAILLSGETLAIITSNQAAYANNGCNGGNGGPGGTANNGSSGADGGNGGDCIYGFKAGSGGESQGNGANGGNIIF